MQHFPVPLAQCTSRCILYLVLLCGNKFYFKFNLFTGYLPVLIWSMFVCSCVCSYALHMCMWRPEGNLGHSSGTIHFSFLNEVGELKLSRNAHVPGQWVSEICISLSLHCWDPTLIPWPSTFNVGSWTNFRSSSLQGKHFTHCASHQLSVCILKHVCRMTFFSWDRVSLCREV